MRLPSGENVIGIIRLVHGELRRAAQNRRAIEIGFVGAGAFALQEINKIAIGREDRAEVDRVGRRNDLRVAVGGQMIQPQAALSFVQHHAQHIFSVGRNRGGHRSAVL